MKRWGPRAIVCAVLVATAATGCSSSAEPKATPSFPPATPTSTATPTATPTPSLPAERIPPERPDLTTPSNETAEALATYFLQLIPYVYATGDLSVWNEFSHPECIYCASVRASVEEVFANGQHDEGGLITVASASATQVSDRWWHVVVLYGQAPSVSLDADGNVVKKFSAEEQAQADIAVLLEEGRLFIRGLDTTVL